MKDFFIKYWLWFAFPMSLYWGVRSLILYTTDLKERIGKEKQRLYFLRKRGKFCGILLVGGYQFIFNFVGSFAGWCCLYVLIKHTSFKSLRLADFVLFILSIMGLSGHLPQFIYGIVMSPETMARIMSKKLGIKQSE